jgi:uncharacterized protein DUF3309
LGLFGSSLNYRKSGAFIKETRKNEREIPKEERMSVILVIILILMIFGASPVWPHSANWGYGPSGGLGFILVVILILILLGRI